MVEKFDEKEYYERYANEITCAYRKDIYLDKDGKERCKAKRTAEREKYIFKELTNDVALIEVPKDMLVMEFEFHDSKGTRQVTKEKLKEFVRNTAKNCKKYKMDYCIASHGGTSDYVYICNIENLIEGRERECKKEIAKKVVPKEAIDFLDLSNLGKTLIPIINRPHWKHSKYHGAIHKIIAGKNPDKQRNKIPDVILQKLIYEKRPEIKKSNHEYEDDINSIPLTDVISTVGLKKRGLEYQGSNPWHGSATGMNFAINTSKNVWYCFRCNVGGSVAKAIGLNNGIISSCSEDISSDQFKEILKIAHDKYGLKLRSKEKKENNENNDFIWNESRLIKIKSFPQDLYSSELFGYGLLLPKEVDNIIKDQVVGKKQILAPVLITKNGNSKIIEWSLRAKEDLAINFPSIPSYLPQRWKLEDIKRFLDGTSGENNKKELLKSIVSQYEKYLFIRNPIWYKVNALWDIGTYLYQIFEAYPLRENRGLAGTGKSKEMTISSYMTFNGGQIMVNPSEATLFRETEEVKGTKYFDEAEKLWVYNKAIKQYEGDVRTELINASYTKEAKVPRQEKIGNKFVTKWYSPYSPTMLSSINGLFGATETRCITRITTKSPNGDKRGEKEPSEDRNDDIWAEIRDKCYRFALENWKEIKNIYNNLEASELKRRNFQIWKPLLAISKFIDEKIYREVLDFAVKLTKRKIDDLIPESSFDYQCLSAMRETILSSDSEKIYVDAIKVNYCFAKGDEQGLKDIYLNRNISNHLDKMGFKEFRDRDKKKSFFAVTRDIFNEIVAPISPNLIILDSITTPSTPFRKERKKDLDDKTKKGVDGGDNGDGGDVLEIERKKENILKKSFLESMKKGKNIKLVNLSPSSTPSPPLCINSNKYSVDKVVMGGDNNKNKNIYNNIYNNKNSLTIFDFFKENPDRIINLEEIEAFFPNPKEELDQLKQKGVIFELQKDKYQYLG